MKETPIIGFAGFSGTGKTTLIEKLIPELTNRGLTVAVVKHDAHGLKFDHEGKDSWRFSNAGAKYSLVSGPGQMAMFVNTEPEPEEMISMIPDADLVIVEGYKLGNFPQIGLCRIATGKGFTSDITRFKALVTDMKDIDTELPIFGFEDIEKLAEWIIENNGFFK